MGWIQISERLPKPTADVLLTTKEYNKYLNKNVYKVIKGCYIAPHTIKAEEWTDYEGDTEYFEDEDGFYIPKCWCERCDNWGDYIFLEITDSEVIAWMPLPEPYND